MVVLNRAFHPLPSSSACLGNGMVFKASCSLSLWPGGFRGTVPRCGKELLEADIISILSLLLIVCTNFSDFSN